MWPCQRLKKHGLTFFTPQSADPDKADAPIRSLTGHTAAAGSRCLDSTRHLQVVSKCAVRSMNGTALQQSQDVMVDDTLCYLLEVASVLCLLRCQYMLRSGTASSKPYLTRPSFSSCFSSRPLFHACPQDPGPLAHCKSAPTSLAKLTRLLARLLETIETVCPPRV